MFYTEDYEWNKLYELYKTRNFDKILQLDNSDLVWNLDKVVENKELLEIMQKSVEILEHVPNGMAIIRFYIHNDHMRTRREILDSCSSESASGRNYYTNDLVFLYLSNFAIKNITESILMKYPGNNKKERMENFLKDYEEKAIRTAKRRLYELELYVKRYALALVEYFYDVQYNDIRPENVVNRNILDKYSEIYDKFETYKNLPLEKIYRIIDLLQPFSDKYKYGKREFYGARYSEYDNVFEPLFDGPHDYLSPMIRVYNLFNEDDEIIDSLLAYGREDARILRKLGYKN